MTTEEIFQEIERRKAANPKAWPGLEGRLRSPLTTEEDAVKQLVACGGVELSVYAKKILKRLENEKEK